MIRVQARPKEMTRRLGEEKGLLEAAAREAVKASGKVTAATIGRR